MTPRPSSISRAELHKRVWETTVIQLAKELGIAESRLRKLCARNNVPMPSGGGYWTLKKWGKAPKPTPLPVNPPHQLAETQIVLPLPLTPIEQVVEDYKDAVTVPIELVAPLACVIDTQEYYALLARGAAPDRPEQLIPIHVSEAQMDRAMRLMDTLLKLINLRGYSLVFKNERLFVLVDGEEVRLRLRETKQRIGKENVWTGKFRVQIHEDWSMREYNEVEGIPVELQLPKILVAIERESKKIKQRRTRRALREADDAEGMDWDD